MRIRRRIAGGAHALAGDLVVQIALQREGVSILFPVHAKAALALPPIVEVPAIRMFFRAASKAHAVNAVVEIFAIAAAVAEIEKALLHTSTARGCEHALGFFGVLGDDVDDAIYGIRSPDGSAGSADDFDPVDVVHVGVLRVPIGAGKKRCVDRPAVDQNQNRTRQICSKAANSNRPVAAVDASDLDAGNQS